MNTIMKQLKVRRDEMLFDICICMAGAALGVIGCLIGEYMGGRGENLWGSGIITFCVFLLGMLALAITGIASVLFHFNLLVGMSCTRKDFLKGFIAVTLVRFLIIYGCSGIVYLVEGCAGAASGVDMSIVFSMLMVLIIMAGTAVILFAGACILKFGYKVTWVFWTVWMAACILPSRISSAMSNHTGSIFDRLGKFLVKAADAFTPVTASALGVFLTVVLSIISIVMLLRQDVRY
ncbi:hypothetical protein D7X88_07265 [bacterium C-53]|nr:hypothetical protein [Lachnospiraceae bacterium]NBI03019.1 hypothetical protein [Lachnospiraceae bacterium]RKJ10633.1 hypothetical protein D7X88_07265 [bacterium C-53]